MAMPSLKGKIAIVTGASRGVGKGIAKELGAAGATVVVTGRTVAEGGHRLGGTITETARLVDEGGGCGIARRVDHSNDAEVRDLIAGVNREFGKIDILVNNVFTVPESKNPKDQFLGKFWELPTEIWDQMHNVGLRSHFIASHAAAPLMIARRSGLIVNISSWGGRMFIFNVPYCVGKTAVDRLAQTMAEDLRGFGVAAVSLYPGAVRTERIIEVIQSGRAPFDPTKTESPELTGRAVAHLASDPKIMEKTGRVLVVAELAREYGFTEPDGSMPPLLMPAQ